MKKKNLSTERKKNLVSSFYLPLEKRKKKLAQFHLSSSGWRKQFLKHPKTAALFEEEIALLTSAFFSLTDFLSKHLKKKQFILVSHDTRNTGPEMAELYLKVAKSYKLNTAYAGTMALPEILSHVANDMHCGGFLYFTASHNPPNYNGIKVGLGDGCVLEQKWMRSCIKNFCDRYLSEKHKKDVQWITNPTSSKKPQPSQPLIKKMHKSYSDLIENITYFSYTTTDRKKKKSSTYQKAIKEMRKDLEKKKVTTIIDYNGSARLFSAESTILKNYDLLLKTMGTQAGVFNHEIVPEGKSLNFLEEEMKRTKKNVFAGMVVDCDGDRGNLLLTSNKTKKIFRLSAQHTFALALLADLTTLKEFFPHRLKKSLVVVNDASSLLIDKICNLYGVPCARSETGEANVLSLAQQKRKNGYEVRMAGEGSNGGSIIFPHTVRDPLTTLLAVLRLFYLKKNGHTLAKIALKKLTGSFENNKYQTTCIVSKILLWFSHFRSTPVFDKQALIKFHSNPQIEMKSFKRKLLQNWMKKENILFSKTFEKKFPGYHLSTKIIQHVGTKETKINDEKDLHRIGEKGGITIQFFNENKKNLKGFWWLRPSQTEPVLRFATEWIADDYRRPEIVKGEKIKNWLQHQWKKLIKIHLK